MCIYSCVCVYQPEKREKQQCFDKPLQYACEALPSCIILYLLTIAVPRDSSRVMLSVPVAVC